MLRNSSNVGNNTQRDQIMSRYMKNAMDNKYRGKHYIYGLAMIKETDRLNKINLPYLKYPSFKVVAKTRQIIVSSSKIVSTLNKNGKMLSTSIESIRFSLQNVTVTLLRSSWVHTALGSENRTKRNCYLSNVEIYHIRARLTIF